VARGLVRHAPPLRENRIPPRGYGARSRAGYSFPTTPAVSGRRGNMHSRIILGVGILGLMGCGIFGSEDTSTPPAAAAPAPPGTDPAASTDGGLPEGAPPASVGTPMPNELTNEFGVFVTATAAAGGDGTKEHPLATISAGIERVKDLKLRVYVCAGTYAESLTLVNAVSVIGSLACDGGVWTTGGGRSIVNAPTSPAMRAKDITLTTRFDGLDVNAPAGTAASPNSIGLIAQNATMLTVANTKLVSSKAFDGADGTDGVQLTLGASANGHNGAAAGGPFALAPFSPIPRQPGAAGGVGACVGAPGHDGVSGGQGGTGSTQDCKASVVGGNTVYIWNLVDLSYDRSNAVPQPSGPGIAGTDGTSASTIGSFSTVDGYAPAGGSAGGDGSPGKGGTGGSAGPLWGTPGDASNVGTYRIGASGPGGGAGGCPGLAGAPGTGGGASVAALVFASPGLAFTTVELVAGDGGRGGKGAFGSLELGGGAPGTFPSGATAGTAGSLGGRAGYSGNGAGGPSIALASTGGAVAVAPDTHTTPGVAGAGVAARTNAGGVTIPASVAGPAMPVFQF
jgi:hypothetical protein